MRKTRTLYFQVKQTHTSSESLALAELRFRRLGKHFMETNNDEIPLYMTFYFFRRTGLLAEYRIWGCAVGQKIFAVQKPSCATAPTYTHTHTFPAIARQLTI